MKFTYNGAHANITVSNKQVDQGNYIFKYVIQEVDGQDTPIGNPIEKSYTHSIEGMRKEVDRRNTTLRQEADLKDGEAIKEAQQKFKDIVDMRTLIGS